MKAKNLDFVIDECRHIVRSTLRSLNVEDVWETKIIEEMNRRIQDEYKYLLRGPR